VTCGAAAAGGVKRNAIGRTPAAFTTESSSIRSTAEAWYPDEGFGFGGRGPITARSLEDEREILTSDSWISRAARS
jgi:hypothetical protein